MPQPVKLSDALVNAARRAAEGAGRSLAGQIEHWARIGRAVYGSMTPHQAAALRAIEDGDMSADSLALRKRLMDALAHTFSEQGQQEFRDYVAKQPYPHYGTHPAFPGCIVEHRADGRMVPGRFHDGTFVPLLQQTPQEPNEKKQDVDTSTRAKPSEQPRALKARTVTKARHK